MKVSSDRDREFYRKYSYLLTELARLSDLSIGEHAGPEDAHRDVIGGIPIAVEIPEKTLSPEQIAKIQRDVEGLEKELAGIESKLKNEQFLARAPQNVVDGAKSRKQEILSRLETLRQNLTLAS